MKNIDFRSLRSNQAIVPCTEDLEKILYHPNENTKSYVTAWNELFKIDALAGASNQLSMLENDWGITELQGLFSPRAELQWLVATEIRHLKSFAVKNAIAQGIEETLPEAVDLGFLATDTGVKQAFFRFTEMAITDMVHRGSMDEINYNSIGRWTQPEIPVNKLTREVCKHRYHTKRILDIADLNEIKEHSVEH